jgi:hypothetical protein
MQLYLLLALSASSVWAMVDVDGKNGIEGV